METYQNTSEGEEKWMKLTLSTELNMLNKIVKQMKGIGTLKISVNLKITLSLRTEIQ